MELMEMTQILWGLDCYPFGIQIPQAGGGKDEL